MQQIPEALSDTKNTVNFLNNKTCCGKCSRTVSSQHAHCGKAYVIKRGMLENAGSEQGFESKNWQLNTLMNYIDKEFHQHYFMHEPVISKLCEGIILSSQGGHPSLQRIVDLFRNLSDRLTMHFLIEANVLFPQIIFLVSAKKTMSRLITSEIKSFDRLIDAREKEHEEIGQLLGEISALTNNYTAPVNATVDYILFCEKLRDLHEKVKQHIYLENNVLYPNTMLLQRELIKMKLL